MSNVIDEGSGIWKIDTASATNVSEEICEWEGCRLVCAADGVGGTVTVADKDGKNVWSHELTATTLTNHESRFPKRTRGLRVSALPGNTELYLYPKTYPGA